MREMALALTFLSSMTCASRARRLHSLLRVRHGPAAVPNRCQESYRTERATSGRAAPPPPLLPPSLSHFGTHDEWVHFFGRRQLCAASSAPPPSLPLPLSSKSRPTSPECQSAKAARSPAPAQPQNFEKCPGRPTEIFLSAGQRKQAKIHGCSWEICKVELYRGSTSNPFRSLS